MFERKSRRRAVTAIALLGAMTATAQVALAGPDQATKNRCTTYAQRAVQQYRLMKSHPECQANTDPMNWQDNYDNHYNACLIFPAKMAEMADASRENHLQACGALSDSPAAAASGAVGNSSGAGGAGSPGSAAPAAAPIGASAASPAPTGANDPECHSAGGGGIVYEGIPGTGITGTHWAMAGNVLTFVEDRTKKRVSYAVVRPQFVLVQIHCTGKPNDNTGTWVWASADGKSGKQFSLGGTGSVLAMDMTGAGAQQMIRGK